MFVVFMNIMQSIIFYAELSKFARTHSKFRTVPLETEGATIARSSQTKRRTAIIARKLRRA